MELINHYLLGGEPEKAEVYLDAAIKQDPKNASFYRAKGTLYEKTERPAQAEEMYVKALELDPKDFLAQYNLGNIKLTEAINFHKKVQDMRRWSPTCRHRQHRLIRVRTYGRREWHG